MTYNSPLYLFAFFPLVLAAYYISPQRHRSRVLLIASYIFFYSISGKLLIYLLLSTLLIHHTGLWLDHCRTEEKKELAVTQDKKASKAVFAKKRRHILWFGIGFQLGILLLLKYSNFFVSNINDVMNLFSLKSVLPATHFVVPIGISFYTLQAVSYLVDVYYEKIKPDDNLERLALYLAFFPTLMEGPISRYSQVAESLYEGKQIQYKNLTYGLQRVLWGLFKKLIIADRLNPLVESIFNTPGNYSGITIIIGAVLYTFQLYADFSGCIDMTIGTGEIFGVTIPENFRQPFFAKTASEFWRRWHITLGTWLKDYVFYPISLTKFGKKLGKKSREKFGKHLGQVLSTSLPLFGVWMANGFWHGTGWHYIFFGMYYLAIILFENLTEPAVLSMTNALHINRERIPYHIFQTVKLLIIVFIGELFFAARSLSQGFQMFASIFTGFNWSVLTDGSLLKLGVSIQDFYAVFFGLATMLIVGVIHERGISIRDRISNWRMPARFGFLYAAIIVVLILGAYGEGYLPVKLIYAGF
jgi:D-alanyl-lipoteichoic acid acyltransferase DltB (MBOAT superfamily)